MSGAERERGERERSASEVRSESRARGRGEGRECVTGLRCAGRSPVRPRSAGVDEVPPLAEPRRGRGWLQGLRCCSVRQRARVAQAAGQARSLPGAREGSGASNGERDAPRRQGAGGSSRTTWRLRHVNCSTDARRMNTAIARLRTPGESAAERSAHTSGSRLLHSQLH